MPLLLPTWILLGVAWWSLSSTAHFRDLALLSLLVYLVVTPAHEVLCEWLSTQPENGLTSCFGTCYDFPNLKENSMPFSPTSSETPIIAQAHADASEVDTPKPRGLLRRLYNWVLSWADSPHGLIALAGISFAESSFFPIPPDVLQVALSVSKPKKKLSFLQPYQ